MSLPQLIVDCSSGRRKVPMVKFLTPISINFYWFDILDKNYTDYETEKALAIVGNINESLTKALKQVQSILLKNSLYRLLKKLSKVCRINVTGALKRPSLFISS